MKTSKLLITVLLLIYAMQGKSAKIKPTLNFGLYTTSQDFVYNKLTEELNGNITKEKIKLNSWLNFPNACVCISGGKHPSSKDKIKNEYYKVYKNSPYKILDTAGFYMYYSYKTEPAMNGKGAIKTDEYFFSTKGDEAILRLTIDNLKKAYPEYHQFHYAIDAFFKSDKDLLLYDNFLHTYKLKYVFNHPALLNKSDGNR